MHHGGRQESLNLLHVNVNIFDVFHETKQNKTLESEQYYGLEIVFNYE